MSTHKYTLVSWDINIFIKKIFFSINEQLGYSKIDYIFFLIFFILQRKNFSCTECNPKTAWLSQLIMCKHEYNVML